MSLHRVYLVDDEPAVRDALKALLELSGIPTQSFSSGEAFLDAVHPRCSGCVLLDLKMTGMDGLEVQQQLLHRHLLLPVVMMTAHGDVSTVRAALKAGAFDFLEKPVDNAVLLGVIRSALNAEESRRRSIDEQHELGKKIARLTARERQVMQLLVEGQQHREIAATLGISPRTVEVYKARMMEKLGTRSLAEVIRLAARAGTASPAVSDDPG